MQKFFALRNKTKEENIKENRSGVLCRTCHDCSSYFMTRVETKTHFSFSRKFYIQFPRKPSRHFHFREHFLRNHQAVSVFAKISRKLFNCVMTPQIFGHFREYAKMIFAKNKNDNFRLNLQIRLAVIQTVVCTE